MASLDELLKMKKEGRTDEDVVAYLKSQGLKNNEIYDLLSQIKIKEAISTDPMEAISGQSEETE